jgi:hypothetical protein
MMFDGNDDARRDDRRVAVLTGCGKIPKDRVFLGFIGGKITGVDAHSRNSAILLGKNHVAG